MSSLDIATAFIRRNLESQQRKPLVVGIQGPQGSGKSYLASHLAQELSKEPSPLRVVVLSIDDLYLPHQGLVAVAKANPDNPLLKGRGQPGTHEIQLGVNLLHALYEGDAEVKLPSFDKSLFNGEGDRLPMDDTRVVKPPVVDVVILEGWFVGFQPISSDDLDMKWEQTWGKERALLGIPEGLCKKENVAQLNHNLNDYQRLWDLLTIFIQACLHPLESRFILTGKRTQLKPSAPESTSESLFSIVYEWRLEQEHYMKAHNGNKGMSDEGVKQ
jgi:D-glycerate 3-kinase